MLLTGSDIIIECLKEQGVDTVFGYPGGAVINVYDALYRHSDEVKHVLTSHEQGASHAADGYARATGKVGVCMATSGPGATNLVTGIATAMMDSVPLVAITCNVGVPLLGKDSFQEIDITGVTMPITKHNFIVKDIESLAPTLRRAFSIAKNGRPGPVLVDVPKDVTAAKTEYSYEPAAPVSKNTPPLQSVQIQHAVEMIREAEKPFIFVGGGCVLSEASAELAEFVERVNAPVTDTLMGKGAFNGEDPLYAGMLGMHGTKTANFGVSDCDLLIAIGVRFSDRIIGDARTFASNAKILQFDIDPAEINKNIPTTYHIIGDVKEILTAINAKLEKQDHASWIAEVEKLKDTYPMKVKEGVLSGPFIVEEVYRQTGGEAIVTTEVGQHQMWAAQYYKYKRPRMLITSGGLGTMGYGLGAAIGAQMARPEEQVVNFAGDGCFRMNINELLTAVRQRLPLIEIVVNNHVLGMVHQWQQLFCESRYSNTVLSDDVNFAEVAKAMGADGVRVHTCEEFSAAFARALQADGPFVIDCMIDSDDKVWPMVAPGAAIRDAMDEDDFNRKNQ